MANTNVLPQKLPYDLHQTQWAAKINPVISNEIVQGHLLSSVSLSNGTTVINHGLARKLIGWFIVGIGGAATIYDNQSTNNNTEQTLSLTSNAAVTVSLWVF